MTIRRGVYNETSTLCASPLDANSSQNEYSDHDEKITSKALIFYDFCTAGTRASASAVRSADSHTGNSKRILIPRTHSV